MKAAIRRGSTGFFKGRRFFIKPPQLALTGTARILTAMSVEEIKHRLAALSPTEQGEVSAFLFHLRRAADSDYQDRVTSRLADRDPAHWLTPEEFDRQLDEK